MTAPGDTGLKQAIVAAGGVRALARLLKISPSAVSQWQRVPAERVCEIEKVTGVPRALLRPHLCQTNFSFMFTWIEYVGTVLHLPDGRPAEVLLRSVKHGSHADMFARDGAAVISLALRHGCSIETLRHALLRNPGGDPASPLGCALDRITNGGQR